MIVGIIGENAIFTYLQFRDSLATQSVDDAVIYAISTRLRPKLMTALGAIIALLPLALGIGTGAQLHQPLAIAVIGGFVIALPLLLIVLPTLLRRLALTAVENRGMGPPPRQAPQILPSLRQWNRPSRSASPGKRDAATIADLSRRTFYDTFAPHNTPENMDMFLNTQFTRRQS